MKTLAISLLTATSLLIAVPASAQVQFDVGPGGVRIGPRYHDEDARFYHRGYHRGWRYGYRRDDCRRVTIERPDGSVVARYRCD
jgi:hypothetical protein